MGFPTISVVVRTKDEAPRLRLTLASLSQQKCEYEIVVVNDGSSDDTEEVLIEASRSLPLKIINHLVAKGRSAASNIGAHHATGDVLLFLDGDTLACPNLLDLHKKIHANQRAVIGRGDMYHLRCTRHLRNPSLGTPWAPGGAGEEKSWPPEELAKMLVTTEQILSRFDQIRDRAQPAIYPGLGPRRLYEIESNKLRDNPDSSVIWCVATGSNLSVRRRNFIDSGGYNERIDINEHRELALRLIMQGCHMEPVSGAGTFHMTHRSGWRDPLKLQGWEAKFLEEHPIPAVALMSVFWGSLISTSPIPEMYRIKSLDDLETAVNNCHILDYDVARKSLGLRVLGRDFWQRA